jgi:hypothetical protein
MNPAFIPMLALWGALALVVIGLALYRRSVAGHEDDFLHVHDNDATLVAQQGAVAHKLEVIDKWGKILTVVAALVGVGLAGYFVYWSWLQQNAAANNLQLIR